MKKIFLLSLAVTLLGAACNKQPEPPPVTAYHEGVVTMAGRDVSIEIAETDDEQAQGLSGRKTIEENQGMLFNMPVPTLPTFWMKGMNFPIDIIWIKGDEVVDISSNVPNEPGAADDDLKTYSPKKPADRVLELKAGWTERNGLKIGDKVEILHLIQ
jgi:uncharacterized protein